MRRVGLALVLAGLLGSAPVAKITGPSSVPSGTQVINLDAGDSVSDQPLEWRMDGPPGARLRLGTFEGSPAKSLGMVYNPPDGTYRFKVVAIGTPDGGTITADADVFTVTVGDGSPDPVVPPDDRPKPKPPTPPVPVNPVATGRLFVAVAYKLDMLEPDLTAVRIGKPIVAAEGPLDFAYRTYADTDPAFDAARLREQVEGRDATPGKPALAPIGYPALIVYDANRVYVREACPTDPAAIVAKVKALRGSN